MTTVAPGTERILATLVWKGGNMRGPPIRLTTLAVASQLALACASVPFRPTGDSVQRVAVNGAQLAYVADGTGPPLVIIHGGWGDLRSFALSAPILADRSMVVRVSLRFHWPNQRPDSERDALATYRVEQHAADVVALIERLGRGPADVLGHSYGGVVAALVAQSRPDLIRRLVLVEPSLYGILSATPQGRKYAGDESGWRDGLLARIPEGMEAVAMGRVIFDGAKPGTFDGFPEPRRRIFTDNAQTVRLILTNNWVDVPFGCGDARLLRMPVLIVEGERTDPDMRQIDTELLACLPDARRVVLANATHRIQFDAPEALAREVSAFLRDPLPVPWAH